MLISPTGRHWTMNLRLAAVCLMVAALQPIAALAQAPAGNTGRNANITRELSGTLRLQTKSDQRYRGQESWRMFVHPDGSRSMMLSKDFVALNALQIMTAHVDRDFRPIDVHAAYWTRDGYRGSIRVALGSDTLRAVSEGPAGTLTEAFSVPHQISVVTHGESMNGWYLWQGEADAGGHHNATYFNLTLTHDTGSPVRGHLNQARFRYLGSATVTVPAGTFETERYLLGNIEMWIAGADRILVKQAITGEDKEYVLTRLETVTLE